MSTQTILVIDDSTTIRKMVDSHLTQEGYRVVLAPTAEKGLELAESDINCNFVECSAVSGVGINDIFNRIC